MLDSIAYHILLCTTDIASEVDPSVEEVLQYNVDMLVMASPILTSSLAEECRKAGTPVIMFNRRTGESGTWSVTGEKDRKSVVEGKSMSTRVNLGGSGFPYTKKNKIRSQMTRQKTN